MALIWREDLENRPRLRHMLPTCRVFISIHVTCHVTPRSPLCAAPERASANLLSKTPTIFIETGVRAGNLEERREMLSSLSLMLLLLLLWLHVVVPADSVVAVVVVNVVVIVNCRCYMLLFVADSVVVIVVVVVFVVITNVVVVYVK